MFFFIDETINNKVLTDDEMLFFSDLASSYRHGYCHLSGSLNSLNYLKGKLGEPATSIYQKVIDKYTESKSVMESISKIFVISSNSSEEAVIKNLPKFLQCRDKIQVIYIKNAISWNLKTKCCLLAENLNDCQFYRLIAKAVSPKGINIDFHDENGGGSTIASVLNKCVSQDKVPTLCIIDSDYKCGKTKTFPQIPMGDTLKNAMDVDKKLSDGNNNPPYKLFPLYVHEVENLIPLYVFCKLKDRYQQMADGVDMLYQLRDIRNGEPILYYDIKNGFSSNGQSNLQKETYWEEIFKELNVSDKKNQANETEDILFFPGLSSHGHLLSSANYIVEQELEEIMQHIDCYLTMHWNNIGKCVAAWGCVNLPEYA